MEYRININSIFHFFIMKKILMIHHSADLDGVFSGALLNIYNDYILNKDLFETKIVGYNYGKDDTVDTWLNYNEEIYDNYIFVDITPPINWLSDILTKTNSTVKIYDHHHNVYQEILNKVPETKKLTYNFEISNCGAMIFYQKCLVPLQINQIFDINQINNIESILYLVDEYDTWKWKNSNNIDALALNEFFNYHNLNLSLAINLLDNTRNNDDLITLDIDAIINFGKSIINFKQNIALFEEHLIIELFESKQKFVIINNKANTYSIDYVKSKIDSALNQPLSGIFHNSELEKYIGVKAIIFYNNINFINDKINLSVRGVNSNFDCCEFIKFLTNNNGGGHYSAAGGSMELSKLQMLIKTYN